MPSFRCKIKKLRFQGILTEKETKRILVALDIKDALDKAGDTAELKIVGETTMHYECSRCGGAVDKWDNYCKHCGAKMKGDKNDIRGGD